MVLLSQAQSDRAILAKQLGISEHQLSYITHSNSGEGLLFYGNVFLRALFNLRKLLYIITRKGVALSYAPERLAV